MISQIARASLRSEIVLDFNCYMDTEIGLIRLIKEKYLDDRVFNTDLLNSDMRKIILLLYNRKEKNPLYLFAKDGVSKEDLDDYYREFMDLEYSSVLSRSVSTEIKTLLELFKTEPSIHVTFLCKSQKEKNILVQEKFLRGFRFVLESDNVDFSQYSSFYFKYIDDNIDKYIYPYKTYYFSKYRLNFSENFNFCREDIIDKIIFNKGEIEILDLYNIELLKKGEKNNVETI